MRTPVALIALFAMPALADTAGIERMFVERAAISAADETCSLFSEPERYALRSGLWQNRGELLRNGYSQYRIDDLVADARDRAKELGCQHPAVRQVAATVRDSYRAFSKTAFLEFPSQRVTLQASREARDWWAVQQTDKTTGAIFGMRRIRQGDEAELEKGKDGKAIDLRLAVAFPYSTFKLWPASVQLRVRDPGKAADPWLGTLFGASKQLAPPPKSVTRTAWAGESYAEKDVTGKPYMTFYFTQNAVNFVESLDPSEAVELVVTPNPREADQKPRSFLFEASDLRAARYFAMIPPAPAAPPKTASAEAAPAAHH